MEKQTDMGPLPLELPEGAPRFEQEYLSTGVDTFQGINPLEFPQKISMDLLTVDGHNGMAKMTNAKAQSSNKVTSSTPHSDLGIRPSHESQTSGNSTQI
jgi:hypothetical protein